MTRRRNGEDEATDRLNPPASYRHSEGIHPRQVPGLAQTLVAGAGDEFASLHTRIDLGKSDGFPHVDPAPEMGGVKVAGMIEPGGGSQFRERMDRRAMEIMHTLGFVRHDQSAAACR